MQPQKNEVLVHSVPAMDFENSPSLVEVGKDSYYLTDTEFLLVLMKKFGVCVMVMTDNMMNLFIYLFLAVG
jgi:hypothetical protein